MYIIADSENIYSYIFVCVRKNTHILYENRDNSILSDLRRDIYTNVVFVRGWIRRM